MAELSEVHRLAEVTVLAISTYLSPRIRELFASELPPTLGAAVQRAMPAEASPATATSAAASIEARLVAAGLAAGQAREVLASVCRVLTEELSNDALDGLRNELPDAVAGWLVPPSMPAAPPPRVAPNRLAAARPGSTHPLSEAAPAAVHSGSVVAPDPHEDTKLSSSPGTTQERQHETLGEGHPDLHPLSTSRE